MVLKAALVEKVLEIVAPDATSEQLRRATLFVEKVLNACDLLGLLKKPRAKASLTKDELRDFNRFYSVYPRKQDRGHAENMFRWALAQTDIETIVTGATRYAQSVKGRERDKVAHPGTWLRGKRWLDEYESVASAGSFSISPIQQRAALITLARKGITTSSMTPEIVAEAKRLGPLA